MRCFEIALARWRNACARRSSARGGTPVEGRTLGDGVLATFASASDAIARALECASAGDEVGLALHLGLHAGDVIREEKAATSTVRPSASPPA